MVVREDSAAIPERQVFWMDPITKVGLVEPMGTMDAYRCRGLGSALLCEGIRRLKEEGVKIIKVGYEEGNEPARRLYHGCGFKDLLRLLNYERDPSRPENLS